MKKHFKKIFEIIIRYNRVSKKTERKGDKMTKQSRKNQDDAELFAKNAEAYYNLENYDSAIKEMDKAISLEPRNSDYYYGRALAYNNSIGDYLTSGSFEEQSKKVKNRFQRSIED